jgi:signal transduction histidine kinase
MTAEPRAMPGPLAGLSVKLIATIVLVILTVEIVLYLPSVSNFRDSWLENRLRIGLVAARVLDAVPDIMAVPTMLTDRLLMSVGAAAVVYRRDGQSQLIERSDRPEPGEIIVADTREQNPLVMIGQALDTLFLGGGGRTLRIVGNTDGTENAVVEMLIPERIMRNEMLVYSSGILFLSLVVAAITAAVLYIILDRILIGPIRRMSENMLAYRQAPENATLILQPRGRNDEIGVLEAELAAMEQDIFSMLRQRRHLADLGLAVAKINHDLRNTLTSAQMLSDQVVALDDPKIQRLAPRLLHSIDKAVAFAQSVLDYGRQSGTPPKPVPVDLRALVDESAIDAGLRSHPSITFDNSVPDAITVKVDPEQLARVLINLMKNAREALEAAADKSAAGTVTASFARTTEGYSVSIADDGPGLPPRARENLFVAFEGSAKAGGTGLGLAIARELVAAHGGTLGYTPLDPGTRFDINLPAATLMS